MTSTADDRNRISLPFSLLGGAAVIGGGLIAAAVAREPTQNLVWMSAYLVLVVGVAQYVFGAGQLRLSERNTTLARVWTEWVVFNLGNAGVIAGTLLGRFWVVFAGTLVFDAGIALFLANAHGRWRLGWLAGYRVLLLLILASSLVGLALSAVANLA